MAERKKESPAGTMGRKALAAAPSWRGLLLFSRLEAGDGIPKNIVVAGAGGVKAPGEEGRGFPEEEDEAVGTIEAAGAIAAIALRSLKVGPAPPRPALSSLCPSPLSSYSHVKQLLVAGERGGYKVTVAVHWGHWRWSCPEERERAGSGGREETPWCHRPSSENIEIKQFSKGKESFNASQAIKISCNGHLILSLPGGRFQNRTCSRKELVPRAPVPVQSRQLIRLYSPGEFVQGF